MEKTELQLTIRCKNDGKTYQIADGSSLLDVGNVVKPELAFPVVSAKVNNVARGLDFRLFNNADVEFFDITDRAGMRTYTRSLLFVVAKAVEDLYDGVHLGVDAPISNGYYLSLRHADNVEVCLADIRRRVDEIIAADIPFRRVVAPTDEAIKVFEKAGMNSKVKLLRSIGDLYTIYYMLDGYPGYYFSEMCPSTGYISLYGLEKYHDGLLLRLPDPDRKGQLKPMVRQEKMLAVFEENHNWQDLGCLRTVGELNEACARGYTTDVINVSEALQEKKICHVAEAIQARNTVRLVLISGPSSSGKTTFSKRLSVQLMACGMRPFPISMDEYFVPRVDTPLDENGNYDFESIYALNLPLLADHLHRLFDGQEVELPHYDFQTGQSVASGKRVKLRPNDVLIMEGIHALNPKLTETIDAALKYKVYVSALTSIQLDDHNYIPTTDNRLLRRIVRDHKYRGYSATDTIRRWPSVMAGEQKWIFPYQEEADAMFNSALLFELAGLRDLALPLLEMVPQNVPEYAEAHRLRKFLRFINPISTKDLPPISLLREFLGGSSFKY